MFKHFLGWVVIEVSPLKGVVMICEQSISTTAEKTLTEFDIFIKKFNLEGSVSGQSPHTIQTNKMSYGNCCGTCEHCGLA